MATRERRGYGRAGRPSARLAGRRSGRSRGGQCPLARHRRRRRRRSAPAPSSTASAHGWGPSGSPGAPGIGDPYFPLDGNGGYDARHYLLDLRYDPATDMLRRASRRSAPERRRTCRRSTSTSSASTSARSRVNGRSRELDPRRARADDHPAQDAAQARALRRDGRLRRRPADRRRTRARRGRLVQHRRRLAGRGPAARRGGLVPGQRPPARQGGLHVPRHGARRAARWSPTASCAQPHTTRGWTTWVWDAPDPMASYLTTVDIGEFDIRAYRAGGLRYWDAVDPDLYTRPAPRTGEQFAISQSADTHLQAPDAHRSTCRRGGGAAVVLGQPRHRAELGLLLRRGAHRRRRRLDHAAGRQRPHERRHGLRLPVLARAAPVPRALRDRQRRRHVLADGHDRHLVGGLGRQRRLRAVGGRPLRATPASRSRSRCPTPATTSFNFGGVEVDDIVVLDRRGARRRSRTTATPSTAGRSRARPRAARRTRTTGSPARPRTPRRRSASSSTRRSRASRTRSRS